MASVAIMVAGAIINAAAFTGGNYLAKFYLATMAKQLWMKNSGMTKPLRNIKQLMKNGKRIAQNS